MVPLEYSLYYGYILHGTLLYISFHRYYGLRVKGKNLFLRTMSGFQSLAMYDANTHQTGAHSDRDPSIPLNRGVDELPIGRGPLF